MFFKGTFERLAGNLLQVLIDKFLKIIENCQGIDSWKISVRTAESIFGDLIPEASPEKVDKVSEEGLEKSQPFPGGISVATSEASWRNFWMNFLKNSSIFLKI